jgi:mannose-6-phosphate isomerase-like protein (cupin superfamily)
MNDLKPISIRNAPHYVWGDRCDGWFLVKNDDFTIIQECMPPGTHETRHRHRRARQFFYVLAGTATMEHDGSVCECCAGEGLEIAPGVAHRIINRTQEPLAFIVFSRPPSHGDRVAVESDGEHSHG